MFKIFSICHFLNQEVSCRAYILNANIPCNIYRTKAPEGVRGFNPLPFTHTNAHTHTAHTSQTPESLKVFPSWVTSVSVKIS